MIWFAAIIHGVSALSILTALAVAIASYRFYASA